MGNQMWSEKIAESGVPVIITSMITEQYGRQYRSIVTLGNGQIHEAVADTAQIAEKNVLEGLNVDWSSLLTKRQ